MAREKMVTRTVDIALVTCMTVDVTTQTVSYQTFEIVGLYPNNDKALEAVKKSSETDTYKIVMVKKVEQMERLYGMTEAEFIAYAKPLPPRGTKSSENE